MQAVAAWIFLVLLPGCGVALTIVPNLWRQPVLLCAVSPALGFGLSLGSAAVLNSAGLGPWPWVPVIGWVVVVAGGTRIWSAARELGRTDAPRTGDADAAAGSDAPRDLPLSEVQRRSADRTALVLLSVAIVVGLSLWLLPSAPSVPSTRDVQNHAYFVARISYENTISSEVVLARSPASAEAAATYYPLAAHSTMAMAHRAIGTPIPDLLMTWTVMAAAVTLPCGFFSLARRLLPTRRTVAGWAALVGACTVLFPYQPMYWGGVAMVIGMACVPGVVAIALSATEVADRRRSTTAGLVLLAALATAGTTLVHTSQLALLALLLGAVSIWDIASARGQRRAMLRRWGVFAMATALLLSPALVGLATGANERDAIEETIDIGVPETVGRLITFDIDEGPGQIILGALTLAGIVLLLRRRREQELGRLIPYLLTMAFLVVLSASLMLSGPPWEWLRFATAPWYRSWWRIPYNLALLSPIIAAVPLDMLWRALQLRSAAAVRPMVAGAAVAGGAVALTWPTANATLEEAGTRVGLFSPAQVEMFSNLADAERADPGADDERSVVLNQENDGTVWLYVLEGIPTYSALQGVGASRRSSTQDWLLEHLDSIAEDGEVRRLLDQEHIRWVLVRDNTYHDEPAPLEPATLATLNGLQLIDRQGSLWLFAIEQ